MPYLQFLSCEHCGLVGELDIDQIATTNAYADDGRNSSSIVPTTLIWDYLVYRCSTCGKEYKYTYKDVERNVREYFSKKSDRHKAIFDAYVSRQTSDAPLEVDLKLNSQTLARLKNKYEYQE